MKIVGIIPARYASTRFPGKPLADINGKTMIRRVYDQATMCAMLTDVVVATDDTRIFDHVTRFGGKVVMTSSGHRTGTERCAEALRLLGENYSGVINIQGDEPYIAPEQIALVAGCLREPDVQIATLIKKYEWNPALADPGVVKAVPDHNNRILYFSRQVIPFLRDSETPYPPYYKHIGLYGFKAGTLTELVALPPCPPETAESLEQLRWLFYGYSIKAACTETESLSVDTPADLSKFVNMP